MVSILETYAKGFYHKVNYNYEVWTKQKIDGQNLGSSTEEVEAKD